jgi:hypothetical protein
MLLCDSGASFLCVQNTVLYTKEKHSYLPTRRPVVCFSWILCYLWLVGWRDGGGPSSCRHTIVPSRSNRRRERTGAPPPPDLFFVTYCWRAGGTEVVPHHVDIQSSRLVVIAQGSVQGHHHHYILPVFPGPAKIFHQLSS